MACLAVILTFTGCAVASGPWVQSDDGEVRGGLTIQLMRGP